MAPDTDTMALSGVAKKFDGLFAEFEELRSIYIMRDEDKVRSFLEAHPALVPLLLEAPARIRRHFSRSRLRLNVFDHYGPDDAQVFVLIPTRLTAEEGLKTMDAFEEDWGDEVMMGTDGKLMFDVEYV